MDDKSDWNEAQRAAFFPPEESAISNELINRMEAFVRDMAVKGFGCDPQTTIYMTAGQFDEARAIVAELPQPVDPDLLEARAAAGDALAGYTNGYQTYASGVINAVRTGNDDDHPTVVAALAAIKRGRALERGEP